MNKVKHNVSLRKIAKQIGVSPMTVSRAINGSPLVKSETRNMVMQRVRQLGYDVQGRSKNLRSERRVNVALHCSMEKLDNAGAYDFYSQLYYFCVNNLKRRGLIAHTVDLNSSSGRETDLLGECGSLIVLSPLNPEVWQSVKKEFPDLVSVNVFGCVDGVPSVMPDDVGGGEVVGRYLHGLGHSHVGVFVCLEEQCFRLRYSGFLAQMQYLDADAEVDLIRFQSVEPKEVGNLYRKEALDIYFAENSKNLPSVIFAPNWFAAVYLYQYLNERGIRVPDNIGVVGYDNVEYYQVVGKVVSRPYFEVKELAEQTVECLSLFLEKKESRLFSLHLPVKFLEGDSVLPFERMRHKYRID